MKRNPFNLMLIIVVMLIIVTGISIWLFHWYNKPLIIVPVSGLNSIHTSEDIRQGKKMKWVYKNESYLVSNFRNYKDTGMALDTFVKSHKASDFAEYDGYSISFYKESSSTTVKSLVEERVSAESLDDLIFIYQWSDGKFSSRWKFKDNVLIEPSTDNIIITDAPN